MLPGLDGEHDLVARQHGGHGHEAAAERLAQHQDVGLHALVVARQHAPRARNARLHLVRDEQHVVALAGGGDGGEVAVRRHHHARLALDGLHLKRHDVGVRRQRRLQRAHVGVRHLAQAGQQRAVAAVAVRVVGRRHGGHGAAPEVAVRKQHDGGVRRHALHLVPPPPRQLQRRLARLHARVHGQHAVVPKQARDVLLVRPQLVVVEGARRQRDARRLLAQRAQQARVAVPLVHRRVRRQEVKVRLLVHVPHHDAQPA